MRALAALAVATAALSLPIAAAQADTEAAPVPGNALGEAALSPVAPSPIRQGEALPAPATNSPPTSPSSGGVTAKTEEEETEVEEVPLEKDAAGEVIAPDASAALQIPSLPASSCAATGVPPMLIPIYQQAAAKYALGPQGPAVLAGINAVETGFGQNLGPSSAGALGWMQFMPPTWEEYGVDANGDGVADPNNPEDAIFAAAS